MTRAADPLVTTKMRSPPARPRLVTRPRLIERLTREPARRLTLVSAPAGSGKTTLLSEWANSQVGDHHAVAWLSLEHGDNDPARFLSYLAAALARTSDERFGAGVLAALHSPQPSRLEALAAVLVNEVAGLAGEVALILDDYHLIDAGAVHGIVSFLLEHAPPNLHLVVSGRANPPLPIARLRARGQLAVIDAAALAFTADEATAFLRGVMDLNLPEPEIAKLGERTEGWIAGLQLAALSMRGRGDDAGFIAAFSGGHRDVLDFLTEEVLTRQPADVRAVLLETSIPDALTGPLVDALTGRTDGQPLLERLDRENLFVVALDDERRWYRYHHLFRDVLRDRLAREQPERVRALYLRASGWYEANGYPAEAIEHALAAPDHERAMRLITNEARPAWSRGDVPAVLRWLEAVPAEAMRHRPDLLIQHALALALTGRADEVEPLLRGAEQATSDASDGGEPRRLQAGAAAAIRAWCARLRGDAPAAITLARRALSLVPAESGGLRAFAAVCLGDALWTSGELAAADAALADATRIGRVAGHVYSTLSAMTLHARVQVERGRLRAAQETLRRARRFVTEQGIELLPAAGAIHIGIGALRYERNDLEGAERAVQAGVALAERTGNVTDLVWGLVTHSRLKRARRDDGSALELAHEAERVARAYGAELEIAIAAAWMTRLRVLRGDLADIVVIAPARPAHADGASARMVDGITAARLLHVREHHDEAVRLLDELRDVATAQGRGRDLIEILSLQALARRAANDHEAATSTLADALALAAPEGYLRTFVDEGPAMAALLTELSATQRDGRTAAARRVPASYLGRLLAALAREADAANDRPSLPEPLSARELEVLRLVAAGESNHGIAAGLFVGVGTVKTHLNNLYGKLGVHSRTQAVARARELGLL